jgi:hypothetical protein
VPVTVPHFIWRVSGAAALLASLALAGAACSKKDGGGSTAAAQKGPELGEPVGAQIGAHGKVPAMEIAFALGKGIDPAPLLPKVVSAVSAAIGQCPAFVEEDKDAITAIDFTVEAGKLKPVPRTDRSAGAQCIAGALDGKDIGTASKDARVEIKWADKARTP